MADVHHFDLPQEPIRTILVVEDELLIRLAIVQCLQEAGFIVLEACNADKALSMIGDDDNLIDLVFSDITMPGSLDGIDLAKWIHSHRPELPIILTSGGANRAAAARALLSFVAKPYDLDRVVAQIGRSLAQ